MRGIFANRFSRNTISEACRPGCIRTKGSFCSAANEVREIIATMRNLKFCISSSCICRHSLLKPSNRYSDLSVRCVGGSHFAHQGNLMYYEFETGKRNVEKRGEGLGRRQLWVGTLNALQELQENLWLYRSGNRNYSATAATQAATRAASTKETSGSRRSGIGLLLGTSENSLVDVPIKPKPRKFFDLKAFRRFILRYKQREAEAEEALVRRIYTKPLPAGWTVQTFLERIGITENVESIANSFASWTDLANASVEDLYTVEAMTNEQRRLVMKHIRLYNHGLWPENSYEDYIDKFQAPPLANEGKPWTEADDAYLLQLAQKYDANFGDPWLYISWEMQRETDEVHSRYTELITIPRNMNRRCEAVLTKCTRPLFFSRYFKLLPPILYVIPSNVHFRTEQNMPFVLPKAFEAYRREDCFRQKSFADI